MSQVKRPLTRLHVTGDLETQEETRREDRAHWETFALPHLVLPLPDSGALAGLRLADLPLLHARHAGARAELARLLVLESNRSPAGRSREVTIRTLLTSQLSSPAGAGI